MAEKDELQKFIDKSNDPNWWRNITDELNNTEVRLSRADLDMILRIRKGKIADKDFKHDDEAFIYNPEHKDIDKLFSGFDPKRRYVPSKWEKLKVQKFIKAIREGRMKTLDEKREERQ